MRPKFTLVSFAAACLIILCTKMHADEPAAYAPPPGGLRALNLEMDGHWIGNGVAFSPYRRGQSPDGVQPTDAQILEDLRLVARYWHLIRLYQVSPMAESTLALIAQHHLPIRVILGAWINPERTDAQRRENAAQMEGAIRLARRYPDIVIAINVGNEAGVSWSDHRVDPAFLIRCIERVRGAVAQPVTTADDYNFWNKPESRPVAAACDFVMLHMYALWNGQPLDHAMAWTASIYRQIAAYHAGRPVIIGETGWATDHDAAKTGPGEEGALMKAETSVAAQEVYLRQHYAWVEKHHVPTLLFEAFDESWKGGGAATSPNVAEKHWGVFDEQRRPKASFRAIINEFYAHKPAAQG
ncbi:glycosyl hydrolases family 17 [mine drainage metagenome]|uniref:Endo-1,3-beta-glucanase btgC n=1 Tax=mine drainage metagenome TaxID=410659 RepID=A0A1J5SAE0_9ZZZZ